MGTLANSGGTTLSIQLDSRSRTFSPGDVITGNVSLVNQAALKVKGLSVCFYGEAEVYWTESEVRHDTVNPHYRGRDREMINSSSGSQHSSRIRRHVHREFRNHETLLCDEIVLLGSSDNDKSTTITILPGIQAYEFHYKLPKSVVTSASDISNLPSSYNGSPFGMVRYSVEARLKRPMFRFEKTEELEFFVEGILDLRTISPSVLQPFVTNHRLKDKEGSPYGSCCCWPSSSLDNFNPTIEFSMEKTGFLPGDTVRFCVTLSDFIGRLGVPVGELRICVRLEQIMVFRSFDKDKSMKKVLGEQIYYLMGNEGILPKWEGEFKLEADSSANNIATNLGSRSRRGIIGLDYRIVVETFIMGKATESFAIPIVVGSHVKSGTMNHSKSKSKPGTNPFLDENENDDIDRVNDDAMMEILDSNAVAVDKIKIDSVLLQNDSNGDIENNTGYDDGLQVGCNS